MILRLARIAIVATAVVLAVSACGSSGSSTVKTSPNAAASVTPAPTAVTATLGDPIALNTADGGQVEVTPITGGASSWTSPTTYERMHCLYIKVSIKNTGSTPVSDSPVKCATLYDSSGLTYPAINAKQKDELTSYTLQPGERAQGLIYFKRTSKLKANGPFPDFRYAPDAGMGDEFGRWTLEGYTIPKL